MYYKIENFIDDDGKMIVQKTPCEDAKVGDMFAPKTERIGTVGIKVRTPQGVMPMSIEFPFPEELTLAQCFEAFEEFAKKEFERMKKEEQEQNLIVPASSIPTPPSGLKLIK